MVRKTGEQGRGRQNSTNQSGRHESEKLTRICQEHTLWARRILGYRLHAFWVFSACQPTQ